MRVCAPKAKIVDRDPLAQEAFQRARNLCSVGQNIGGLNSEILEGNRLQRTFSPHSSKGIWGFGLEKFKFGGVCPFLKIIAALIKLANPLAASRCPILVFTEPNMTGEETPLPLPNTLAIARVSMGSPTSVPVP